MSVGTLAFKTVTSDKRKEDYLKLILNACLFPSILGTAGEKHVLLCLLSGFKKHVMHLLPHLKVSSLPEFTGKFGLVFMLGPGLPIVL